jgi:mRNA-degrading endonuclease toxin of MazEF toxin-antitoxin module
MDNFAAEKNLVFQDCYVNLDQMRMLGEGTLEAKVDEIADKILKHIHQECQKCKDKNKGRECPTC